MSNEFKYDAFLSYSSKDKEIVHALAQRLKQYGLRVWLDAWAIKPGDSIPMKIQQGLEQSRTLLMCMSPPYFASDWGNIEHLTLPFRDPTDAKRNFIPVLIADCSPPETIAQFANIDWREQSDGAFAKLMTVCRAENLQKKLDVQALMVLNGHSAGIWCVSITPDGQTAISGSLDRTLKVWDLVTGMCRTTLAGHIANVLTVTITPDGQTVVTGSEDMTLKVWDLVTGMCRANLEGHTHYVRCVAVTPDGQTAISGSWDKTLKVWDLATGKCRATLKGHAEEVQGVAITPDGQTVISCSADKTVKVWDLATGKCRATLKGHASDVLGVAITPDGKVVVSGSWDKTLKVWNLATGKCQSTLEGHEDGLYGVAIAPDGQTVISGSADKTLKAWDLATGKCRATLKGHASVVLGLAITPDSKTVISGSLDTTIRVWSLPSVNTLIEEDDVARYTCAKVVLVGDSGVGKTGLALRLCEDRWEPTESTHGMIISRLELPPASGEAGMEREVWLWDFAGQPDYRLIHQLYMDEAALGVLVFNPQDSNPFEEIGHWEKTLRAAAKCEPSRLLVAARCDRGGITVSRKRFEEYVREHGFADFLCTGAKTGEGCEELKEAIAKAIPWERLPWTATSRHFKTLKDAILMLSGERTPLVRLPELRQRLQLMLPMESVTEADLRAVVGLMQGQGVVQALAFGDFLLLSPAWINRYASVVVRMARKDADEMGVVLEQQVLDGDQLDYKDMERLAEADERILLRAIVQTFLDRSLCLRQETPKGTMLVFPSYFNRDKPDLPEHPNVFVTYGFAGPLEEIYSTLVVRLGYSDGFKSDQLWKDAADFKTPEDKRVGLAVRKMAEGTAEIVAYFDAGVPDDTKVTFIKYIHEHLLARAQNVTRVRHYVCPHCDEPLANRQAIQHRLGHGQTDIICPICEYRVPLLDLIEEKFASNEFLERVKMLDERARINLDNESRELILVGHALAIAAEAGQIFRPVTWADWGIDGEIEFKDSEGKASGRRVYLLLKLGDSSFHHRKRDNSEVFTIRNPRHAEYWLSQPYPVMLVIRTSDGKIRWMNITDYLKRHGRNSKRIVFKGEPFTAMNILGMRERVLGGAEAEAREQARFGEQNLINGDLDEALMQFVQALTIKSDNKYALEGLFEVALRSIDTSLDRMDIALNNIKEYSPIWLAKHLCKNLELIKVSLTQQLIVRISMRVLPVTLIAEYSGGFGWEVQMTSQMTSFDANDNERKTQTLAISAERLQGGIIQLTANAEDLQWGLYIMTIRFLAKGKDYWSADRQLTIQEPRIPYIVGPPIIDPNLFFGRDKDIREVLKSLDDYSIVLLGPRRSGKTSFLHHLEIASRPHWTTMVIDLHGFAVNSTQEMANNLLSEISRGTLNDDPGCHPSNLQEFRRKLEENGVNKLVVFLDEMAVLADHPQVAHLLRHMSKWQHPKTRIVITGTYSDFKKVTASAVENGSGPFNEFEHHALQEISQQYARDLLVKPVLWHYIYEDDALDALLKLGYGRPFFLNLLGRLSLKFVRSEYGRVIHLAHVESARKEAAYELEPWFEEFLVELDDPTRSALPMIIQKQSEQLPWGQAEALFSAGLTVGPRSSMRLCPLFVDWWNLRSKKGVK